MKMIALAWEILKSIEISEPGSGGLPIDFIQALQIPDGVGHGREFTGVGTLTFSLKAKQILFWESS